MAAIHEAGDIQAIIDRGFGSLAGATYTLLRVLDAKSARAWLRTLPVTSLAQAQDSRLSCVRQVAFTAPGLRALGLDPEAAGGFSPEFLDGMAGSERKSFQLGDRGINSPADWAWGVAPAQERPAWPEQADAGESNEPHILLILFAPLAQIAALEANHIAAASAAGCKLIRANRTNGVLGHEPFGFADGLSQPEPDWEGTLKPGRAQDRAYRNHIAAGEFLLGHPNEYGFVADYPKTDEVGRNGTYLVYRQLAQDVRGFWKWVSKRAGREGAIRLAELMVGRGIDGAALAALKPGPKNEFTYAGDPDGVCCPIGAHIRRANPRSGDDPNGDRGFFGNIVSALGLKGSAMHDAVASSRFHRIMRRGRAYGPVIDPLEAMSASPPANEEETGLHFICLNASLARQFEFVQGAWVASAYFGGLSCEQDPMLGNRLPDNGGRATEAFAYVGDGGSPELLSGMPQFVQVRGGAYFFLPGIRGLSVILGG